MIISIAIIMVVSVVPALVHATLTASFGGKVLLTKIPGITCIGIGTGPVVLSSNLESFGSAVLSATGVGTGGEPTAVRVGGTVAGLYGAIPFYANPSISISTVGGPGSSFSVFVSPQPKIGDWILGEASLIPNFNTCLAGPIPFPVRQTSNYKVSPTAPSNHL
jgi:hypothetical protein